MFQNKPDAESVAAPKNAMGIAQMLGLRKKEEINPVIDARLEGLSVHLDERLPPKGCFKH